MIQNFKGKLLLDMRITFGGVAGCGSFGCPADAWKELMLHEFKLVHVFRWVDNNLFVREMGSKTSMTDIVQHSTELGLRTNKKKYAEFAATQKFIGFIWDGINKTATLSEGKAAERISQLEALASTRCNFHSQRRWCSSQLPQPRDIPTTTIKMLPLRDLLVADGVGKT
jgi:hypothetical protein